MNICIFCVRHFDLNIDNDVTTNEPFLKITPILSLYLRDLGAGNMMALSPMKNVQIIICQTGHKFVS